MDQPPTPARTCPKCSGGDYQFRTRKQIEATAEQGAMLETKYGEEWKEKVLGALGKRPAQPE